ncbi:hypothetical protein [Flavobacterium cyanobacteriorum]|nr:hypothetical protein [Flavobacterium cyanobacteriorum]
MKIIKFFLAMLTGFGIIRLLSFVAEVDVNDEEEYEVYDDEAEYPLFV